MDYLLIHRVLKHREFHEGELNELVMSVKEFFSKYLFTFFKVLRLV